MGFCEYEDKAKFTRNKLLPLAAAATDGNVEALNFECCDGTQTVSVVYKTGETLEVDVTGDTLMMMAMDVLGAIA